MDTDMASNLWGLEPLLNVAELASYLGVPVSTVCGWRTRGVGPRAYRFDKYLKFAVSDVRIWIELQREIDPREAAGRSPDEPPAPDHRHVRRDQRPAHAGRQAGGTRPLPRLGRQD